MLSAEEVQERVAILRGLPVEAVQDSALVTVAAGLAISLDHSVYDCLYLATAIGRSGVLVTADRQFVAVVRASPFSAFIRPL
jgi:predicted nucleic acid-binding protein